MGKEGPEEWLGYSEVNDFGFSQGPERLDGGARLSYQEITPGKVLRSYRFSAVLRWEYRRGSTVFLVWQQQRFYRDERGGDFDIRRAA